MAKLQAPHYCVAGGKVQTDGTWIPDAAWHDVPAALNSSRPHTRVATGKVMA